MAIRPNQTLSMTTLAAFGKLPSRSNLGLKEAVRVFVGAYTD